MKRPKGRPGRTPAGGAQPAPLPGAGRQGTRPDQEAEALRDHFLGWQCRIRQLALRRHGGRPTSGMRPAVRIGGMAAGAVTTLLVRNDAAPCVARFRHLYLRTHDPAERHESALHFFAAAYYQRPREFSDRLSALFSPDSRLAKRLREAGRCTLEFRQFSQGYVIPCTVAALARSEPAFEFTLAHNRLFNPGLPSGVQVLGFTPRWREARAEPPLPAG